MFVERRSLLLSLCCDVYVTLNLYKVHSTFDVCAVHCSVNIQGAPLNVLYIYYLLITPKQPNRQKNDKSSKHKRQENTKKTYATDTANVFHTDFLIKDTELSNR